MLHQYIISDDDLKKSFKFQILNTQTGVLVSKWCLLNIIMWWWQSMKITTKNH